MKLYDNGELVHVDSSKDIIEHFGIKGMTFFVKKNLKKLNARVRNLKKKFLRNCKIKVTIVITTIWLITSMLINIMINIIEVTKLKTRNIDL